MANFDELVEMSFGSSVENAVRRAINLECPYDDMVRLVALYRREQDPFLDVEAFVKDGASLGVATVMNALYEILEDTTKA